MLAILIPLVETGFCAGWSCKAVLRFLYIIIVEQNLFQILLNLDKSHKKAVFYKPRHLQYPSFLLAMLHDCSVNIQHHVHVTCFEGGTNKSSPVVSPGNLFLQRKHAFLT